MPWNPDSYNKFQHERELPFEDLFRLLNVRSGLQVIDLGCGTGRLTRQLADRLPDSAVLDIDSSAQMLAAARGLKRPGLRFESRSIQEAAGEWDLVFSHAALQWLDNHVQLIPRLFALVRPGGQLAIQIPDNYGSPAHQMIVETARAAPFVQALGGWSRTPPNLSIERYAELLHAYCGEAFTVFAKIYPVILADADALLDWSAGTALLPYLERLPEALRASFKESYRRRLWEFYPAGPIFSPFRRILFAGTRRA